MALPDELLKQVGESRGRLGAMSPEESRDVARWLREEIAPALPSERQRELAEQSASRFEHRAVNPAPD